MRNDRFKLTFCDRYDTLKQIDENYGFGSKTMMKTIRRSLLLLLSLLLILPAAAFAEQAPVPDGTLTCTFTGPDEVQSYVSHLFDGDTGTTVTIKRGETLRMQIEDGTPSALFFDFYERPDAFTLSYLDADGNALGEERFTTSDHHLLIPLDYGSLSEIELYVESGQVRICEWYACTAAFIPPFTDRSETADVLAVLNEPGDELYLFGGLFAMLAGEHGLSVQVVYLTAADGYRTHQCMDVLRGMGVLREPVFGQGRKSDVKSDAAVYSALGGDSTLYATLTSMIRTLQPKLVLAPDAAEEQARYSDGVIARTVLTAAGYAADAKRYPDTNPYKVKKVYTLGGEGGTTVSLNVPLYAYDGMTANALAARLGMFYAEDRVLHKTTPDELRLTLRTSTVGDDKAKNDLIEHLPTSSFAEYRVPTPTPAPTEAPTSTPTLPPTVAPTEAPTGTPLVIQNEATETPVPETPAPETPTEPQKNGVTFITLLPALLGAALAAALFVLLRKTTKRALLLLALIPLLLGLTVSFLLTRGGQPAPVSEAVPTKVPTEAPTEAPMPEPTEEPTPEPTPEPTAEPTEAPTPEPTPDPNDAYFLSGEGEEYELDFENGHWRYKSSVLSIDIEQVNTTTDGTKPLVYYAADIRMRDYSSFRSGLGRRNQPWIYARREKAVLAITGDNLVEDEKELKGCLIRQGVFYCDYARAETLAILPDMTLEVLHPGTFTARQLLDHGVRDTYAFGPILVENGEICGSVFTHRITHPNPRCGVGMVEPGHWVAIVSDGRQRGYSESISLEFFAQLFIDRGCVSAFNLDGGSSAGMVFMGETLNKHLGPNTEDVQRNWMDSLMFGYSEQVPDANTPTEHNGIRKQ